MDHTETFKVTKGQNLCLSGPRTLVPSAWGLVARSAAVLVCFLPTKVSVCSLHSCDRTSQLPWLYFSFWLWLAFRYIVLENNPQSEENKSGTLVKKYCKCMSLLVSGKLILWLITRNLLCKHKLFGRSFYKLNGALSMHTSPTYPFWIVPTSDFAVPRPLIF